MAPQCPSHGHSSMLDASLFGHSQSHREERNSEPLPAMASIISSIGERIRKLSLSQKDSPPVLKTFRMPVVPEFDVARLPAEIRLSLLKSADNLFTLRCLATSSASFLLVYNDNRKTVLDAVMSHPMDLSLLPECAFASATSRVDFEAPDVGAQVARFLHKYHERKESPSPGRITGLFNKVEQAQHMKRLVFIVDDLCKGLCTRAAENIGVGDQSIIYDSLSVSEKHRLHRAFFRYELFSNLYRDQGLCLDYDRQQYAPGLNSFNKRFGYGDDYDETAIDEENMARSFLLPFSPWEIEEFACVHDYVNRRWSEVMIDFQPHFLSANPNSDLDGVDPSIDLSPHSFSYEGYRRHFSMLGLEFLHTFLMPGVSVEERQRLLRQNVHYGTCDPSSVIADYQYRINHGNPVLKETNSAPVKAQPNPGWKPLETKLAEYMPDHGRDDLMRRSGVIFWDADRMKALARRLESKLAEKAAVLTTSQGGGAVMEVD